MEVWRRSFSWPHPFAPHLLGPPLWQQPERKTETSHSLKDRGHRVSVILIITHLIQGWLYQLEIHAWLSVHWWAVEAFRAAAASFGFSLGMKTKQHFEGTTEGSDVNIIRSLSSQ